MDRITTTVYTEVFIYNNIDSKGIMVYMEFLNKIIKDLNEELKSRGYIIRPGMVSRKYFYERTGIDSTDNPASQEGR